MIIYSYKDQINVPVKNGISSFLVLSGPKALAKMKKREGSKKDKVILF